VPTEWLAWIATSEPVNSLARIVAIGRNAADVAANAEPGTMFVMQKFVAGKFWEVSSTNPGGKPIPGSSPRSRGQQVLRSGFAARSGPRFATPAEIAQFPFCSKAAYSMNEERIERNLSCGLMLSTTLILGPP
jgi:hypothetical protein